MHKLVTRVCTMGLLFSLACFAQAKETLHIELFDNLYEFRIPSGFCVTDPKSSQDALLIKQFAEQQQQAKQAGFIYHYALYNCRQKDAVVHQKAKIITDYFILGSYAENKALHQQHLTMPSKRFVELMYSELTGETSTNNKKLILKSNRKKLLATQSSSSIVDLPIAMNNQCLFFTSIAKTPDEVRLSQTNAACLINNYVLALIKYSAQNDNKIEIKKDVIALAKLVKTTKVMPVSAKKLLG